MLKEVFKRNSYPEKFTNRRIKNFSNKLYVPKIVELTGAIKELILPYYGQQSFEIRNRIQCYLKKNAPVLNLKVVFQSKKEKKTLSTLFAFKDKINKILHSSPVSKFKCKICNDIYYGKTKRYFKVRACERLRIII